MPLSTLSFTPVLPVPSAMPSGESNRNPSEFFFVGCADPLNIDGELLIGVTRSKPTRFELGNIRVVVLVAAGQRNVLSRVSM